MTSQPLFHEWRAVLCKEQFENICSALDSFTNGTRAKVVIAHDKAEEGSCLFFQLIHFHHEWDSSSHSGLLFHLQVVLKDQDFTPRSRNSSLKHNVPENIFTNFSYKKNEKEL